jgi:predicted RNase H-like nuclease (RuvC/YqgF family)
MYRISRLAVILLFVACSAGFGQSLGEVARQARDKEKFKSKVSKKLITNEDIPESPELSPAQSETAAKTDRAAPSTDAPAERSAGQWRFMILKQKDAIETLQARINKLSNSIHFVTANETSRAFEYNQYQVKKQQEMKNLQNRLEDEYKKLDTLQNDARKEGMGTSVYDP